MRNLGNCTFKSTVSDMTVVMNENIMETESEKGNGTSTSGTIYTE